MTETINTLFPGVSFLKCVEHYNKLQQRKMDGFLTRNAVAAGSYIGTQTRIRAR